MTQQQHHDRLRIILDEESLALLRAVATAKGVRPSTLVRMWILERLRTQQPDSAAKTP